MNIGKHQVTKATIPLTNTQFVIFIPLNDKMIIVFPEIPLSDPKDGKYNDAWNTFEGIISTFEFNK